MKHISDVFKTDFPMLAMLHLKGDNDADILERAKKEIDIYYDNGADAVVVENYYGNYYHMEMVLEHLQANYSDKVYGVNCLNLDVMGFELAHRFGAKFVQLDSVVGHVKKRDEYTMEAFLDLYRKRTDVFLLGGVRFKYQPVLSTKTLEEDLKIAMTRCDAIVVTGNATGEETDLDKIISFREIIGDFPLIIGAGVTPSNALQQFHYANGAIVGSYLKHNYKDEGEVDAEHVKEMANVFKTYREGK